MTVQASDASLIARTRGGDMSAYDELYRRHVDGASTVARIVTGNADEAPDLVNEAFTRVLAKLTEGGGPHDDLGPYLRTVVRRLAVDRFRGRARTLAADPDTLDVLPTADDPIGRADDKHLVRTAFETLPERWQRVLWHTEIEGRSPASLASTLGMAPNAVAALAYRAREGLRQAYLTANLPRQTAPGCRTFVQRLPAFTRGTLTAAASAEVSEHLATCADCRERRDELFLLGSDLRSLLIPALFLPAMGWTAAAAGAGTAAAGGGLFAWLSPTSWAKNPGAVGGVAAGAVVAGVVTALILTGGGGDPVASPPTPPAESESAVAPENPDEPTETLADRPAAADRSEPSSVPAPAADAAPMGFSAVQPPDPTTADPELTGPRAPDQQPPQPSPDPPLPAPDPPQPAPDPPQPAPDPAEPAPGLVPPSFDVDLDPTVQVREGGRVHLSVRVSGHPAPDLQWQRQASPGAAPSTMVAAAAPLSTADLPTGWTDIGGADGTEFVISTTTWRNDGERYRVVATNSSGTDQSSATTLEVTYGPQILAHPGSERFVDLGATVTLTATVRSNPVLTAADVTWEREDASGAWTRLDARTAVSGVARRTVDVSTSFTAALADDDTRFRAVVDNGAGEPVATDPARLSLQWRPVVVANPQPVHDLEHGRSATLSAVVRADGSTRFGWQQRVAGTDTAWRPTTNESRETRDGALWTSAVRVDAEDFVDREYRLVARSRLGTATTTAAEVTVVATGRLSIDDSVGTGRYCVGTDTGNNSRHAILVDCADADVFVRRPGDDRLVVRGGGPSASDHCLTAPQTPGGLSKVTIVACGSGPRPDFQSWSSVVFPPTSAAVAAPVTLRQRQTVCLAAEDDVLEVGTVLSTAVCDGGPHQRFRFD